MTSDPTQPRRGGLLATVARRAGVVTVFVLAALLGTLSGVLFAYADDLPEITALDNYKPSTITRLLARDGQTIGEFATQRRVVVGYDDISPFLRQAIIATEDASFEQHFGLSVSRILITAVRDIVYLQRGGASTLTQQLARDLFLRDYLRGGVFERTGFRGFERKVKEAIVAIQLEKRFTKREILTFYANQIYFGHGAYGVEAASRLYFDKPAKDVTVEEAATIAAIIQAPERLSPFVDPKRALQRRNYVLDRMADEGFLPRAEVRDIMERPLVLQGQPTPDGSVAPYFVEDIRKQLEQEYGAKALYEAGLTVQTTLDAELQEIANVAVDRGLRRIDKRRTGSRRAARNVSPERHSLERFTTDRWAQPILESDIVPALVMSIEPPAARIRIGPDQLVLPKAAFAWTRRTSAADLFKVGDLIEVQVTKMNGPRAVEATLEQ